MSKIRIVVLASAIALLLSVLNLVRRRRLREEYSWLWLLTSATCVLLVISHGFYNWIAQLTGASNATLAFAFLGLYFLAFISIQFSMELSRLTTQTKDLAQQMAILDGELKNLRSQVVSRESDPKRQQSKSAPSRRSLQQVKQLRLVAAGAEVPDNGGRQTQASGPEAIV